MLLCFRLVYDRYLDCVLWPVKVRITMLDAKRQLVMSDRVAFKCRKFDCLKEKSLKDCKQLKVTLS